MKIKPSIRLLCLVFAHSLISACSSQDSINSTSSPAGSLQSPTKSVSDWAATITLENGIDAPRKSAPIYLSLAELGLNAEDLSELQLITGAQAIAFETIDRDGDGNKDGLFTLADMGAQQSLVWQLKTAADTPSPVQPEKLTQAEISIKDGGKWAPHPNVDGKQAYQGGTFKNVEEVTLPEFYTDHSTWIRYEGPGIESDKVGYRVYLDHRNGFDIFGKKSSEPVLQKIGQDGYQSYHSMLDWGMDILKVGSSLGAGGFGFWNGESLTMVSDTKSRGARIVEDGALYSSFAIDYGQWLVDGERRDASALLSMHGGSRLVHTRIKMDKTLPNLAVGVVKHPGTEFLQGNMDPANTYSYIGSWGQQSESGDHLGMAVIFKTQQFQKTVDDNTSYVALMQPESNADSTVLEYYFVAAWQGEHGSGIGSKQTFVTYLENEIQKLSEPLSIDVAQRSMN